MDGGSVALVVLFAIIGALGIVFNSVVIEVIRHNSMLHTPMNYLLMNLAISDIIIAVFILPRHVFLGLFTHPTGLVGDFLCKFVTGGGIIWIGATAEGYTLITIACERFFAIVRPHDARARITTRKLRWIVPLCWAVNTAVNLPSLSSLAYNQELDFCQESWPNWVNPTAYVGFVFVVGVSSVIVYASPGAIYGSLVYNITVLFILINSSLHPFLLCWHMRTFRQGLWKVLGCGGAAVGPLHMGDSVAPTNTYNTQAAGELAIANSGYVARPCSRHSRA
ncbi:neuromedin-U receptor 2-like [Nematostella vectensis]|uniref:neuromedin-U receptor 2-like n=1 Tax=Nematostella vectensis TaxID=45351 RepID=UPI00207706D9|nr:neuromedin-U receptor 2-like [Nematostella vectensis]